MADTDNIVIEHLRHIRDRVDSIDTTVKELRDRMGRVEREVAGLHVDFASLSGRLDTLSDRVDRIERRLDLEPAE